MTLVRASAACGTWPSRSGDPLVSPERSAHDNLVSRRHMVASLAGLSSNPSSNRSITSARPPTADDRDRLAELMLDAYVGTIDYDGETMRFDEACEKLS